MNNFSSYQDTNTPWIGEIPTGWSLKSLKHIFTEKKSTKNPDLGCGSISFGKVIYKDDEKIPQSTKESYQEVLDGEFLINPLNLNYDLKSLRIGLSRINVVVSQGYIVLNIKDGFVPEYYEYLLRKFDIEHMKSLGQGVRQTISYTHLKDEKLVVPPVDEQKRISRYLDKKTSQLDSLIYKIEKKIELLREQRTSLINQYVTKGLDTDVEMKNSGNKLVGLIPKHWKVVKASYILDVRDGTHDTPTYVDDGVPLVTQKDIFGGVLSFERTNMISTQDHENISKRSRVVRNDVIMSMIGSIGFPTVVETDSEFSIKNVCLFRTSVSNQNPHFIKYVLESNFGIVQLELGKGGGVQSFVSLEVLRNLKFLIPPRSEQDQIVDLIKSKSQTIDRYISLEQRRLSLLNEYRQSFISSATTGKLRVTEEMI